MPKDVTALHEEFGGDRLPPGQRQTDRFPVLTKGDTPAVDDDWTLSVTGAVEQEQEFTQADLRELGVATQRQDFHCVTGWSKFDCEFTGITFPTLAAAVGVDDDVGHVMFAAHDGYTTDLTFAACDREEVLFVWSYDGEPLPTEHGGPLRVVTPHKYAYKGAKWVSGVEFLTEAERGYWERRGYSDSANPWNEERYS